MTSLLKLFAQGGPSNCEAAGCGTNLPSISADNDQLQGLLAVVFGLAAALAILTIVIASINLITGGGDPDKISRAKKTIIFALVGLAIALSAEAIVLTVLDRI